MAPRFPPARSPTEELCPLLPPPPPSAGAAPRVPYDGTERRWRCGDGAGRGEERGRGGAASRIAAVG